MRRSSPSLSVLALALSLLAGACGGGDGGVGGITPITPVSPDSSPSPSPSPTPTSPAPAPSPTPTPTPGATPTSWAGQAAALYDVPPDLANCRAGTLKASVTGDFLARLNALRALHNLPPVSYEPTSDAEEAASALMMAVNKQLSHSPPSSWTCYSAGGANGAGTSNLVGWWGTGTPFNSEDDFLGMWLNETTSDSIGHRRWILSPFLGRTSYGRVSAVMADGTRASAASMRVTGFTGAFAAPAGIPPFVAYPYGDYPSRYFSTGSFLSFTAIANAGSSSANNAVSFAAAAVSVAGPSGAMAISDISYDNTGYGVPNSIQWHVAGLQPDVTYTVTITGVTGAPQTRYSYTFRII